MLSLSKKKPIQIRSVYTSNLESEFNLISTLITKYPYVAMDTEFPGVAFRPLSGESRRNPNSLYLILKTNVDALNLIQIGLTLSDYNGNLPDLGSNTQFIWEFNFCEFDMNRCHYDNEAIDMLKKQGINFEKNLKHGIRVEKFAELMMTSGLVMDDVSWVTFHSAYDFGYLVKALTGKSLPGDYKEFLKLVRVYFGDRVYDLKYMMRFCEGLYGGLDKVAKNVGLEREVGKSHQAGSDSLLTWRAFEKISREFFKNCADADFSGGEVDKFEGVEKFSGVLYGLEIE